MVAISRYDNFQPEGFEHAAASEHFGRNVEVPESKDRLLTSVAGHGDLPEVVDVTILKSHATVEITIRHEHWLGDALYFDAGPDKTRVIGDAVFV